MEVWRDMVGFEEYFSVSDYGRFYNKRYKKYQKPYKNKSGYLILRFEINKKAKYILAHRAVGDAFLSESHTKETINHKNFDKTDNRASNLEWMTNLENIAHAKEGGKMRGGSKPRPFGATKICRKCKMEKPMELFNKGKGVGGKNPRCIECEKQRCKDYYRAQISHTDAPETKNSENG